MEFYSILYDTPQNKRKPENENMPDYFTDLNLDQIFQEILSEKEEYRLEAFYYNSLNDTAAINYRLEVMKELECEDLLSCMCSFSRSMKKAREYMGFSQDIHNRQQSQKWHLDSVYQYCKAVRDLSSFLKSRTLESKGLILFRQWLDDYTGTKGFSNLAANAIALYEEFLTIKYSLQIERDRIIVNPDESENNYSASLIKIFEKINESVFDYKISFFTGLEMCRLESCLLEILQRTNTGTFSKLDCFCREYGDFLEPVLVNFDREIQFYISYIEFIGKLKRKGFQFAFPRISDRKSHDIAAGYDLALAFKLSHSSREIISSDFLLGSDERIAILTGPNQGGKTTYARALGQILHLSSIGCPVPCQKADIFLFDRIFTHFSEEEASGSQNGSLKEELVRLSHIAEKATENSVVIINELFATTTTFDAYTMGKKILEYFIRLDCFCLYVTHIYELAQISRKAVSYTAAADIGKKEARTYRIVRKPADGQAYANTIVEKYRLNYKEIKERITT
jgi:hypothetical protein